VLLALSATALLAQQPILYTHATYNAASYAPFGLPNAPAACSPCLARISDRFNVSAAQINAIPPSEVRAGLAFSRRALIHILSEPDTQRP
jgi:hypothetical protein